MKVNGTNWPTVVICVTVVAFLTVKPGAGVVLGTVTVDGGDVTGPPVGGVPVAVAVSLIEPLSRSA